MQHQPGGPGQASGTSSQLEGELTFSLPLADITAVTVAERCLTDNQNQRTALVSLIRNGQIMKEKVIKRCHKSVLFKLFVFVLVLFYCYCLYGVCMSVVEDCPRINKLIIAAKTFKNFFKKI